MPTPLNYWALHHLAVVGGIQITGSHNPPEYNGFKLSVGTASMHGDEIQHLYALDAAAATPAVARGHASARRPIIDRYVDDVVERIGKLSRPMRVVYDCGNGAGALVAPRCSTRLGIAGAWPVLRERRHLSESSPRSDRPRRTSRTSSRR